MSDSDVSRAPSGQRKKSIAWLRYHTAGFLSDLLNRSALEPSASIGPQTFVATLLLALTAAAGVSTQLAALARPFMFASRPPVHSTTTSLESTASVGGFLLYAESELHFSRESLDEYHATLMQLEPPNRRTRPTCATKHSRHSCKSGPQYHLSRFENTVPGKWARNSGVP
jgi:hypothetical protein